MEGMMNDLEEYLSGELLQVVEEWIKYNGSKSIFLPYLRYIKEHQYVYQVTLSNRKALPIKKSFQPLLEHLIFPLCRTEQITDEEELLYYNVYFQSGITMVLKCWIENGCKKSDLGKLRAERCKCFHKRIRTCTEKRNDYGHGKNR